MMNAQMVGLPDRAEAKRICDKLLSTPVAPGAYSHFINVGTTSILESLDRNYFESALADGISCFKYLQGDYGAGKTQFIHCLASYAWRHQIVTSIVNIGLECPFNSPLAIYKAVVSSFLPPAERGQDPLPKKGIEILMQNWIRKQMESRGWSEGQEVDPRIRTDVGRAFNEILFGARDMQAEAGVRALGKMLLNMMCGADTSVADTELLGWVRGESIRSTTLRKAYGLNEPVNDQNAFNRLKTIISVLRDRMGHRGFLIAFDEGRRTASFRRGSIKQKQAIENMLTMINENAEGEFSGVMFHYAATPDFRSDVITKYTALNDRIGSASFAPGRPMVPFIDLDEVNTEDVIAQMGERLLAVFSSAYGVEWDREIQEANLAVLNKAEKKESFKVIPRTFVYHLCMLLKIQMEKQRQITYEEAVDFVLRNKLPIEEEDSR
jgi:hypothetical protein